MIFDRYDKPWKSRVNILSGIYPINTSLKNEVSQLFETLAIYLKNQESKQGVGTRYLDLYCFYCLYYFKIANRLRYSYNL